MKTVGVAPGRADEVRFEPPEPRPARGHVHLAWTLPRPARVELSLHDVSGRTVRRLIAEERPGGRQETDWDGLDAAGCPVPAGLLVARLRVDGRTFAQRLVMLR